MGLLPAGLALLAAAPGMPAYDPGLELRVFDRTCDLVARHYWNKARLGEAWQDRCDRLRPVATAAPDRASFYAQLNHLLDGLGDSHLFAVDPVRVALDRARDAGHAAEGFGFAFAPDAEGRWQVTQMREGSAAAEAGVRPGWTVMAVNGRPVDIDYQPSPSEQARFSFLRPDGAVTALTLSAEREAPLPSRRAVPLDHGFMLIGLDGFDPGDDRWLVRTLADARPRGVVLDLRQNDGGDADVIARVAGAFFAENRPLVDRIGGHDGVQRTRGAGPQSYLGPLAVLIGPESASGAEALAALIDESKRGVTVGARTAGALTGASLYRLPDGGQLSVSEFDIRTPNGRRLEGTGLPPLIPVIATATDRRNGADPVRARAIAWLLAHPGGAG